MTAAPTSMRNRIAGLLEDDSSAAGRWLRGFLIGLIVINVAAVVLGSIDNYAGQYGGFFQFFEVFSILIFTAEYLLRLWAVCEPGKRLRYACTPLMIIDLIVILPFFLGPLVSVDLRILRLFQLLKLFRHFSSLHLLGKVLRAEAQPMAGALAVMAVLILIAASIMHFAEGDVQPEAFGDIPSAMWWAAVTLTTVGYGDVSPITPLGQLIAGFVMVIGVGMVALPAGMLASRFSQELHDNGSTISLEEGEAIICPHCKREIGSVELEFADAEDQKADAGATNG